MNDIIFLYDAIPFKEYKINSYGVILNPIKIDWKSNDKKVSVTFKYARFIGELYTTGYNINMTNSGCGGPVTNHEPLLFENAIRKNLLLIAEYLLKNDEKKKGYALQYVDWFTQNKKELLKNNSLNTKTTKK